MKIIIFFFLILAGTIVAKPTIGIVKLNIKSENLKKQANMISEYIKLSSGLLTSDYEIINSTMDLEELMLVTGCDKFDKRCKYDIADSMKVDYLLYGTIENFNKKVYRLTLSKLTIIDRKIVNKRLLAVKNNKDDYVSKVDTLLKQFFPTDISEKNEADKLLEIKTFVKNKQFSSRVYLDKKFIGKTPIILRNDKYLTGKHTIILKSKGYDTVKRKVILKDGETQVLSINMFLINNPANKKVIVTKNKIKLDKKEEAWYQDWKVQVGAGVVVVVIATVAILMFSGNDDKPTGTPIVIPIP